MLKRIRRMTKIRNDLSFILLLELPLLELLQITHLETVGSRLRSTSSLKHSWNRFATCHLSMHNTASGSYPYTTMLLSSLTVCPTPEDAPENIPPHTLTEWCEEIKLPENKINYYTMISLTYHHISFLLYSNIINFLMNFRINCYINLLLYYNYPFLRIILD